MNGLGRAAIVTVAAIAGAASAQERVPGGPVAVYWVSAQTSSGFMAGMMGGGGGGRPGMGAMMGMMMRGGPDPDAVNHTLRLQLGSNRRPDGAPQAEHDPPAGLNAGPALPLVTPVQEPSQPVEETPGPPQEYRRPHGRMLIFWGCGAHAGPGQPYVIDFARVGQDPQAFAGVMRGLAVTPMQPPSPGRFATYGEWPNAKSRATVPPNGSLVGDHLVRGDYTPDIRFALTPDQDFMAPLKLLRNERTPTGAVALAWNPVATALGYFASAMGGSGEDTVVMWTSSASQAAAFALPDYLAPSETRRLVASGHLMPPARTECLVPQEAVQAMGRGGLVQMAAYGDEANFAWPPRPKRLEWVVKVRYRSTTSGLLGQADPMGGGHRGRGGYGEDDGEGAGDAQQQQQQQQQQHRGPGSILHGLGGFIP
ncbi:MAG: hypothetical protein P4L73_09430 [Caulobacteraceae bacterium]|nr:hypothetical protein [Caulobacteraceae bacterium]